MTIKLALAAAVLAVVPTLSFAMCSGHMQQSTSQCAQGQTWDPATQACVPVVNS